jgi:hypothetical protein
VTGADPPTAKGTAVSQQTPPPGAGGAGGQQPSEEEVRQYLAQLRQAPAEQVLAEVLSGLLNAAQVKVGRRDGRLLIYLSATLIDGAREHVSEELSGQVDEVLGQLRMAQVEGEQEVNAARAQGQQEPNDLGSDGEAPSAEGGGEQSAPPPQQASPPPAQQDPGKRLWTPGT